MRSGAALRTWEPGPAGAVRPIHAAILSSLACAILLLLARAVSPAEGATIQPSLGVVGPGSIVVALDEHGVGFASVTLVNPSDARAELTAELAGDGEAPGAQVSLGVTSIEPLDAARIPLEFAAETGFDGFDGDLVVRAPGFAPAVLDITISTSVARLPFGSGVVIAAAFAAGIAFVLLRIATLRRPYDTRSYLGGVHWTFGSSWATNLTTVGAILGSVSGSGFLAAESGLLSSAALTGLSLFFGTLVILAGFSYVVASKPVKDADGNQQQQGSVTSFLIAAMLTIVAVIGQLMVLAFLLIGQLRTQTSDAVAWALLGLVVVTGVLVLRHSWRSVGWTLENLVSTAPPEGVRAGPPAPARAWNLL